MQTAALFDPEISPPHPLLLAMEYRALAELASFIGFRLFFSLCRGETDMPC